jgi:RNA polymerase sigma-70 factor (ECF subfamily)
MTQYSTVANWLLAIANRARTRHDIFRPIAFWRSPVPIAFLEAHLSSWSSFDGSIEDAAELAREKVKQVWRGIETMGDCERTVFVLRFVEDLDLKSIAEVTGLQEAAIKGVLFLALGKVHSCLWTLHPHKDS